ncbi:acyltransferase family protein [Floccifex sp.]|uniref:acyltransferase family protein n=1 Tax=Floccifex sp. TaxID=2815810 RepID=UPI003F03FE0D
MKKEFINKHGSIRNSNLELYRIVVMLLIVAHHFVVNSGLLDVMYEHTLSVNSIFLFLFGAWGKTGINCFMLITGYFMCKSNITLRKYVKMISEVLFYNIFISLLFLVFGIGSIKDVLEGLLIVRKVDSSNFIACFLVFYLFIPFLNILLQNINQKQHQYLIGLLAFLYVFLGTMPKFSVVMNYVSWFSFLYIVAAYVRLYSINNRKWGYWTTLFILFAIMSVIICLILGDKFDKQIAYRFVSDSNTFLAFAIGFCSFMFFKDLKINKSGLINTIGGSTFGVLCIHANSDTMRKWLWGTILNVKGAYYLSIERLILFSIISVLGVFIICIIIEIIRQKLVENRILSWIEKSTIYGKINERVELL